MLPTKNYYPLFPGLPVLYKGNIVKAIKEKKPNTTWEIEIGANKITVGIEKLDRFIEHPVIVLGIQNLITRSIKDLRKIIMEKKFELPHIHDISSQFDGYVSQERVWKIMSDMSRLVNDGRMILYAQRTERNKETLCYMMGLEFQHFTSPVKKTATFIAPGYIAWYKDNVTSGYSSEDVNVTLRKLKSITLDDKIRDNCSICQEFVEKSTEIPCGHPFHKDCLIKWFKESKKKECPTCRYDWKNISFDNNNFYNTLDYTQIYADDVWIFAEQEY